MRHILKTSLTVRRLVSRVRYTHDQHSWFESFSTRTSCVLGRFHDPTVCCGTLLPAAIWAGGHSKGRVTHVVRGAGHGGDGKLATSEAAGLR